LYFFAYYKISSIDQVSVYGNASDIAQVGIGNLDPVNFRFYNFY
jgi:hypothetical protein